MEIVKNNIGWQIIPSTDKEEEHLGFILDALQETYCKSVVLTNSASASCTHPEDQDQPSTVPAL